MVSPLYENQTVVLRPVLESDLDGIGDIRNDAIRSSRAIWTSQPWTAADGEEWVGGLNGRSRFAFVAVAGERVLGYASCAPWQAREGYRFSLEDSVYLRAEARGRGLGRMLLRAVVDRATAVGAHLLVADIEAGNVASVALHRSLGFVTAGYLTEVGTKFGAWLDLHIMTLRLDDERVDSESRDKYPAGVASAARGPTSLTLGDDHQ